jgi:hypothetical protein
MKRWVLAGNFFIIAIMMFLHSQNFHDYELTLFLFIIAFIITKVIFYPEHPLGRIF